jgi:hydroxymethylglutaryl-CoA reductase
MKTLHDEFIENITNFYIPLGVALIFFNGRYYSDGDRRSSVVAAASKSANYWSTRGGFKATVINTEKIGQYIFFIKVMFQNWVVFFQNKAKFFLIQKVLQKTCKRRWNSGHCLK